MSRKIRLKCPACQTLIETDVADELRVTLECAACRKQFTAKVPPRPQNTQSASPAGPRVTAKPVTAKPVSAPSVTARPVAARPVSAPPATVQLFDTAPTYPQPESPTDPLFADPSNLYVPAPAAYQPVRKRKPLNLRPMLTIGGSIGGVLLVIALGLYGWRWAANTDWSTFTFTNDSAEKILAECYDRSQRASVVNADLLTNPTIDYDQVRERLIDGGRWAERILVRAVRLGQVPAELRAPYLEKMDAMQKSAVQSMEAKMAELKAAGKQPTLDPQRMITLMQQRELIQAVAVTGATTRYLAEGFYQLPKPTNEIEDIYYAEAELVHEYLKHLSRVRNTAQSKTMADKIQALADKVIDLAVRRGKLPSNHFDRVPRSYVSKDDVLKIAQNFLVARIERDAQPDEKLKDAVADFLSARDLLLEASNGQSETSLRARLADARKKHSETTLRGPDDPFYQDSRADSSGSELVLKPKRDRQTDPVVEPPAAPARSQPAVETLASNNPPPAQTSAASTSEPSPVQSNAPIQSPASSSVPSPLDPGLREHFFRGITDGIQSGMRSRARSGEMPSSLSGDVSANSGISNNGMQHGAGAGPATNPNLGPHMNGRAGVIAAQGIGKAHVGMVPGPQMSKDESVKIIITKSNLDGNELVKRLATSLSSGTYSMNYSNKQITLQIKYTGHLDRVVELIDFGKVTLIDSPERTIHVVGR